MAKLPLVGGAVEWLYKKQHNLWLQGKKRIQERRRQDHLAREAALSRSSQGSTENAAEGGESKSPFSYFRRSSHSSVSTRELGRGTGDK